MENLTPEPPSEIMLAPFKFSGEELARLAFRTNLRMFAIWGFIAWYLVFLGSLIGGNVAVGAAVGLGVGLFVVTLARLSYSRTFKHKSKADFQGLRYVTVSEAGIQSKFECGVESFFPWSQVIRVRVSDDSLILPMRLGAVAWIPRSVWTPEALELLKTHVKDVKLAKHSL